MTRSWARRSFAAATIFMARVICCVLLTERSRRRMSIKEAMRALRRGGRRLGFPFGLRRSHLNRGIRLDELVLELPDRLGERLFRRLLELAGRHDRRKDLRM